MATVTFKRVHTANRGASTYKAEGYPGVLQLAKPAFNGEHPETLVVEGVPDPVATSRAAKAKMTPEERKAAAKAKRLELAKLTPEQRAQRAIDAANERLEKERAKAAKKAAA